MLNKFDEVLNHVEKIVGIIAAIALLGLMIVGVINVTGRFLFDMPFFGATEMSRILMAASFLLVLAGTQARGQHTKMTDVVKHYPVTVRHIIEFIVLFVSLVLFAIMVWRSTQVVMNMWQYGYLVQTLRIPEAPFRIMLPFGAFVLCLELIRQMLHIITKLRYREI